MESTESPRPEVTPPLVLSNGDRESLRTLGIFTYILSVLTLLGAATFVMYAYVGSFMTTMLERSDQAKTAPGDTAAMVEMASTMRNFGVAMLVTGLVIACVHFFAARSLTRATNRPLIYISAILACLSFPLGTVLGVFTFIVMTRPSVKAMFAS